MLEIKGQAMKMSAGDTFDITFLLKGYALKSTDTVVFSIKDDYEDDNALPLLTETITGQTGSLLRVLISADRIKQCGVGLKYYDLVLTNPSGIKYTLNYPTKLWLERVVHRE